MKSDIDTLLEQIRRWLESGSPVALATVISTWGSSPRPIGSHLAVNAQGEFAGSVSGGCIEGAVIQEALLAIADGSSRLLEFGVTNEQAWEVGLACGGRIQIHVSQVAPADFNRLLTEHAARRSVAMIMGRPDQAVRLITGSDDLAGSSMPDDQRRMLETRMASGQSGPIDQEASVFARIYGPAPRLLIVGAVHIAQALAPMASLAGFDVTVIDPRRAFASAERFPGIALTDEWPDEALQRLAPDTQTAIVTLTHDPKLDDPALTVALASPAFYIGSLGSKQTHELRIARLTEMGLAAQTHRIHAPVGLDLGGRTPPEIAVAILSEVLLVRYKGKAR